MFEPFQDNTRSLKLTAKGNQRKTYLLMNFDRANLRLQLDGGGWKRVRCVKLTHVGGEIIHEGQMSDLLRERLAAYNDVDEAEEESHPGEHDIELPPGRGFLEICGDMMNYGNFGVLLLSLILYSYGLGTIGGISTKMRQVKTDTLFSHVPP